MFYNLRKLTVAILLLFCFTSCSKDDVGFSLPEKTQEGKNTLGFEVDDKVWVNYGDICNWGKCDPNVVEGRLHTYKDGSKSMIIQAYHNDKKRNIYQHIQIVAKGVSGPGTYTIDLKEEDKMDFITDWSKNDFYTNLEDSNAKLIITRLDLVNNVVSGEFSGTLHNYNEASKIKTISNGRFDTKLIYSND